MNIAGALSMLFESAPGAPLNDRQVRAFCGAAFAELSPHNLLREVPPAASALCTACSGAHLARIERGADGEGLGFYCAEGGGWRPRSPEDLRRHAFDHRAFVQALRRGLDGPSEELSSNLCWKLGVINEGAQTAVIIAAREMLDPRRHAEVAAIVRARFGGGLGAILCGAGPPVDLGLIPKRVKLFALSDMLAADGAGVAACRRALARALRLRVRKHGEHGAPSNHPNLIAYIEARLSTAMAAPGDTAEADALLAAQQRWAEPGAPLPSRDAMRVLVSRRRSARRG